MSEVVILTAEDVAKKLKIHVKSVYASTAIPRIEIGPGTIRYVESQVDQYVLMQSRKKEKRKPRTKPNVIRHEFKNTEAGGK